MKSKKQKKPASNCSVCHKAATRTVDGELSCDQHANLVYENQLEDYTRDHLADGDWKESPVASPSAKTAGTRSATVSKI